MKKFSFAVSYLFHPILIAFYGLLIIIFRLNFVMLNDKFLEGYIIDFDDFKGVKNISCHKEIEINFVKI